MEASQISIEAFLQKIPPEVAASVREGWRGCSENAAAAGLTLPTDPGFLATLVKVWGASPFVMEHCLKDPGLLADLAASRDVHAGDAVGEESLALARIDSEQALMQVLRRHRNRAMVRIAWRDIAGWAGLEETLMDLSMLAEQCVVDALAFLYRQACERYGTPLGAGGDPQPLVVLAMGKLGAWELNFSSDIDLIFAYPEEGVLVDRRQTSHHEFFTKLARSLITVLDQVTADGFVFRVDVRLRPFGDSGPLVMSFAAMENYYQRQAREWERYAMIKARPLGERRMAHQALEKMLRPFVYRRYLDYGAIAELRELKAMISRELLRKDREDNVKLGPGGIREIEFIGQVFQLIRGGSEKKLRERRIMVVLAALGELDLLPEPVVRRLLACYQFLRRVENRLQQVADKQVHDLPTQPPLQARLAFSLGYADWQAFLLDLNEVRVFVHGIFEDVISPPAVEKPPSAAERVWSGEITAIQGEELLTGLGFAKPELALRLIAGLRTAAPIKRLSKKGSAKLDALMPKLLEEVGTTANPEVCLQRITSLLEAIASRSVYLSLLLENPDARAHLVRLVAASPWVTAYIARQPILLDELLDPRSLYAPLTRRELEQQLQRQLETVEPDDLEQQMTCLRQFKQAQVLRVAAADMVGAIPIMVVSDYLTSIAEVTVAAAMNLAWRLVGLRHGYPPGAGACEVSGFGIVAYGKLGGIELGYGSDLDLVFLYSGANSGALTDGESPVDCARFYARLGQRIINMLNTNMLSGVAYEIDMRLRPSGNSGLLVSHIDAYATYQRTQAWTWEQQALIRARFIVGDRQLGADFNAIRAEVLRKKRNPESLRGEVRAMREKMRDALELRKPGLFDLKQGPGGIADIEFIVQFEVLWHAHETPSLIEFTDVVRLLDALGTSGLMPPEAAALLKQAYCGYRECGHRAALQESPVQIEADRFADQRRQVVAFWNQLLEAPASDSDDGAG